MKKAQHEQVVMQHVLEVRLKRRLFSAMDIKGRMMETISDSSGFTQAKVQPSRFDLATDDLSKFYFFSFENFGFQLEAKVDFDSYMAEVKKILEEIKKFPEYSWDKDGLLRIGTKVNILLHRPNDSFASLQKIFSDTLVKNQSDIINLTTATVSDTAYIFEMVINGCKANVTLGPVTFEETLNKFFGNDKKQLYQAVFNKSNGLMFSIDLFSINMGDVRDIDTLEEVIAKQIEDLKKIYSGFRALFPSSQ